MSVRETRHVVPGALIVGGAHVSVGLARSLGRQQIPVWLLADHPLPKFSRYVQRSFPWPGADQEDSVTSIIDIAVRHELKGWVLIATGDENMRLTTANWDAMQWVYDKRLTFRQAASLHIDCAWNFQPSNFDEVQHLNCA